MNALGPTVNPLVYKQFLKVTMLWHENISNEEGREKVDRNTLTEMYKGFGTHWHGHKTFDLYLRREIVS